MLRGLFIITAGLAAAPLFGQTTIISQYSARSRIQPGERSERHRHSGEPGDQSQPARLRPMQTQLRHLESADRFLQSIGDRARF